MNSVLQAILKDNPCIFGDDDLGMKMTDQQQVIVNEIERRRALQGNETFDAEQDRVMELVRAAGGHDLAEAVDCLIGSCMNLYSDSAFALGYYTAKHPEWLIFQQPQDNDEGGAR